jgi:UDP-N-acetyl-D-mannosaminuronate dehydrogenase
VQVADPLASEEEVWREYNLTLDNNIRDGYDAVIVAVAHQAFTSHDASYFLSIMNANPILMDLKGLYQIQHPTLEYWRL